MVGAIEREFGPFAERHLRALVDIDRRDFVPDRYRSYAYDDTPLPLDDTGLATISAPHAYLLTLRLLDLGPGDRLVELGSGSGYGAALAAEIVGRAGAVRTFEIDADLAAWCARNVSHLDNVTSYRENAVDSTAEWGGFEKVSCTFAIDRVPDAWIAALPEGGVLVAPVGPDDGQRLIRIQRVDGVVSRSDHGGVRYVKNRA